MHDGGNHQPDLVDQQMTLAAAELLPGIVATRAGCLGGLHRLAVDNAGGRARLAPLQLPRLHHQSMVDAAPGAIVPPTVEVVLNRGEWRKLPWQHPPMAAALCDIEDRIHHVAHRGLPWPSSFAWWRKQRLNQ